MEFAGQMKRADIRGKEMKEIPCCGLERTPRIEESGRDADRVQMSHSLFNLGPGPAMKDGYRLISRNMDRHFSLLSIRV
jgi:hypothetical protein